MTPKPDLRSKTTAAISRLNNARLKIITELAAVRIEELLDELSITHFPGPKYLRGPCAVHGGDNPSAWNIFPVGEHVCCRWRCYTQGCHNKYGSHLFGFIQGISQGRDNKKINFWQAVDFVCKFLGKEFNKIEVDERELSLASFVSTINLTNRETTSTESGIGREQVREMLRIPAQYYINRDYNATILDRYDVGCCLTQGKQMSNRVVVPVYDEEYQKMVGCTGRSLFPRCDKCRLFHSPTFHCPTNKQESKMAIKWIHSEGFHAANYLYNFWFAKKYIKEYGIAILVEGPGDVWRLEEAEIPYSVAMFGCHLNDEQAILLERAGAFHIIALLDNDEAGQYGIKRLRETVGHVQRLYVPKFEGHDIGDMTAEQISFQIKPIIDKILGS